MRRAELCRTLHALGFQIISAEPRRVEARRTALADRIAERVREAFPVQRRQA